MSAATACADKEFSNISTVARAALAEVMRYLPSKNPLRRGLAAWSGSASCGSVRGRPTINTRPFAPRFVTSSTFTGSANAKTRYPGQDIAAQLLSETNLSAFGTGTFLGPQRQSNPAWVQIAGPLVDPTNLMIPLESAFATRLARMHGQLLEKARRAAKEKPLLRRHHGQYRRWLSIPERARDRPEPRRASEGRGPRLRRLEYPGFLKEADQWMRTSNETTYRNFHELGDQFKL